MYDSAMKGALRAQKGEQKIPNVRILLLRRMRRLFLRNRVSASHGSARMATWAVLSPREAVELVVKERKEAVGRGGVAGTHGAEQLRDFTARWIFGRGIHGPHLWGS